MIPMAIAMCVAYLYPVPGEAPGQQRYSCVCSHQPQAAAGILRPSSHGSYDRVEPLVRPIITISNSGNEGAGCTDETV